MEFNSNRFKKRVGQVLENAKKIIKHNRYPLLASNVDHAYIDKFALAESLVNVSIASFLTALQSLGVDVKSLRSLYNAQKTITLRFRCTETCEFDREEKYEVDGDHKTVSEIGMLRRITTKVVTTVTEYIWNFRCSYQILAFYGNDEDNAIVVCQGQGMCEIKTTTKKEPHPHTVVRDPRDLNASWLFEHISEEMETNFTIDRSQDSCWTPRRNQEINQVFEFLRSLSFWSSTTSAYISENLFAIDRNQKYDTSITKPTNIFIPIVPLFDDSPIIETEEPSWDLVSIRRNDEELSHRLQLSLKEISQFLLEHSISIQRKKSEIENILGSESTSLVSSKLASISMIFAHISDLSYALADGLGFVEDMIRKQLISAIGKDVSTSDFSKYMLFHNRKLLLPEYHPTPFCYAIRRPDHYPEGTVSLESKYSDESKYDPICCHTKIMNSEYPMTFSLNSATHVSFFGNQYLHSWISHHFSGQSNVSVNLCARARQFSSFIMIIGTIASSSSFIPKHAIIVKNKDDLIIPLILETIPTAKEFKDAIKSLSPEQQQFAKSYRQMQLESTLFGFCILQIKPQMEKLLNLAPDALTKEIQLTQNLMELFIQYQIPSDLLSFAGPPDTTDTGKLEYVRKQVQNMMNMIKEEKEKEVEERKQLADLQKLEAASYRGSVRDSFSFQGDTEPVPVSAPVPMRMMMMPKFEGCLPPPCPAPGGSFGATECSAPVESSPPVDLPSEHVSEHSSEANSDSGDGFELTNLPKRLEENCERLDVENAIRPTILKVGKTWSKTSQESLLKPVITSKLYEKEQRTCHDQAYDLIDSLSRSGSLPFDDAELHIVVASSHCFDESVMNTLVKRNINPIHSVERSTLIVASTIHGKRISDLVHSNRVEELQTYSPALLEN